MPITDGFQIINSDLPSIAELSRAGMLWQDPVEQTHPDIELSTQLASCTYHFVPGNDLDRSASSTNGLPFFVRLHGPNKLTQVLVCVGPRVACVCEDQDVAAVVACSKWERGVFG